MCVCVCVLYYKNNISHNGIRHSAHNVYRYTYNARVYYVLCYNNIVIIFFELERTRLDDNRFFFSF